MNRKSVTCCRLYVVNNIATRFATNCNPALLDLIMCSNDSMSIHFDQLVQSRFTDHDVLFYVYDFNSQLIDFNLINLDFYMKHVLVLIATEYAG